MNLKKWACLMEIQQLFGEPHLQFTKEYILLLEQFAPSDSYKRLLDIGCGEGPEEINLLAQMQFQPESFDAGYSCAVMEHCYAPWLSCLEIWITLRDSGIFFMLIPIPTMYRVVTHPNLLSQDQWGFILQHTGFRVTHNEVHTILNTPLIVIVAQKDKPKEKIVQQVLDKLTKIRLGGK
jgi:SAM-dependent methyltransferase